MTSYVYKARPRTEEMLVDEMLAICAEIETWREKKESQEAQARYNSWLYYKKWRFFVKHLSFWTCLICVINNT